ncbi:MAG TPA: lantibiotic immunity ABC transporter MutG family permease subunit [Clostridium sp.]|nr:lantibiotic immunity ABC transporter MutG family permease subunit [Clostridium sp.]
MSLIRLIRAEFLKMKNTSFYIIHICIPLIGALLFFLYYVNSQIKVDVKIQLYLQVLSIVFPLLISIVTSQAIQKEKDAGSCKEVLSNQYGRISCIVSKMSMLLICGFSSLVIAISAFVCSLKYILNQNSAFNFMFFLQTTLIIFGCQIIIYILHGWLNFRFNSGISMLIGTFESILSALMLTGLGDNIWQWLPSGINARLNGYFILKSSSISLFNKVNTNINLGIINLIILTVLFGIIFIYWFNNYDTKIES